MIEFGISVYPEQEDINETLAYIRMAGKYGCTRLFTSMFSIDDIEAVKNKFSLLTKTAHECGITVTTDANPKLFERLGTSEKDLSPIKELGIDVLRMDVPFFGEKDITLVNNDQGIIIEFNAMLPQFVDAIYAKAEHKENIRICYNFYPERYTGVDYKPYVNLNEHYKKMNLPLGMFISSQEKNTHGPWPITNGLCTLEEQRTMDVDLAIREVLAIGGISAIMIGNAYASEEEFKKLNSIKNFLEEKEEAQSFNTGTESHTIPVDLTRKKVLLNIELAEDITDIEKEILINFKNHSDAGDGTAYMLRSRFPRMAYGRSAIPPRPYKPSHFTKGDVVIVNDTLSRYKAEVQIVLKDMENDGQRNFLGRIPEEEIHILDYLKPRDIFRFKEK